jgi:regulator of RNase E activity RraB
LGIDPEKVCLKQLKMGLEVELAEHSDITNGDLVLTAKIALAHLKELPDYYTQLEKMEKKAKKK